MKELRIDIQRLTYENNTEKVIDVQTQLDGAHKAKVNLKKNNATVNYDESCVDTIDVINTIREVGIEVMYKLKNKFLQLLAVLFVIGIVGCSDVPFSGPMLSIDNVDRFLDTTNEDTVCLQDGFDTICLRVKETQEDETASIPVIDIYPESIIYHFYYDNKLILQAERTMDTAELVQQLNDSGKLNQPPGNTVPVPENITTIGEEWNIQIYYPESFSEANRGITLETSGLDIRVATGFQPTIKKGQGHDLDYFRQKDKPDGSRIAEFSVITPEKKITIQVDGLVEGYIVRFYIDVDGVASDEGNNIQLERK